MKIKISRDILGGYLIVIMLMVGWFIFFSQTNTGKYENLYTNTNRLLQLEEGAREIENYIAGDFLGAHNNFSASPSVENLRILSDNINRLNTLIGNNYGALAGIDREKIKSTQDHLIQYMNEKKQIDGMSSDSQIRTWLSRNTRYLNNRNEDLSHLFIEIESLRSMITLDIINQVNEIPSIISDNYSIFLFLFSCVILLSAVFGILFSRKITSIINNISAELNSSSEDIFSAANSGEQRIKDQSESIDRTAATLEELSQFSTEVVAVSRDVTSQVENTSHQIAELKQRAQQINKITSTIEEISHQINILSLNASIEAARAGEQGKGFSAVALEIRKLAENTRGFTENISTITRQMQEYTTHSAESAANAVNLVKNITQNVDRQNTATADINEAMSGINSAMKKNVENFRGTVEVSENILELAQQLKTLT